MIQEFVNRYIAKQKELRWVLSKKHPEDYAELVKIVIGLITDEEDEYTDYRPDPDEITEIDHGNYQGTLLYVIPQKGYQPHIYYAVTVGYGSCSGCDTLVKNLQRKNR